MGIAMMWMIGFCRRIGYSGVGFFAFDICYLRDFFLRTSFCFCFFVLLLFFCVEYCTPMFMEYLGIYKVKGDFHPTDHYSEHQHISPFFFFNFLLIPSSPHLCPHLSAHSPLLSLSASSPAPVLHMRPGVNLKTLAAIIELPTYLYQNRGGVVFRI